MKHAPIRDDHHVVRYCRFRNLIRQNGRLIGVHAEFFHLRPAEPPKRPEPETALSALYFEYEGQDDGARWKNCRRSLLLKPKKNDALVRLHVGRIKEQGLKRSRKLKVMHEPKPSCRAYSSIRGLPQKPDDDLCVLLMEVAAMEAVSIAEFLPGGARAV